MSTTAQQLELLCPAGDFAAMRAAVANGANAVYFGLGQFNARARANNFSLEQLPEVIAYLHAHNVRGYVALNTLIFPDELEPAARCVIAIAQAGADAVIVQDLGLAALIRSLAPTLAIHASTQMTLTEPRGIGVAASLGVTRAILARELSIEQIHRISQAAPAMELEAFVHGAICISFSGQCLASQSLFFRSANRGLCGQACRLPYQLVADGELQPRPDRAYPLSPRDLCAADLVCEMAAAGVSGFKIEGRLKGPQYVAATARAYSQAIAAAGAGTRFQLSDRQLVELAMSFSRGFSHGFLGGADHRQLVDGRSPKSRGMRLGTVTGKSRRGILVDLETDIAVSIQPGDGVVFDNGAAGDDEPGGRVYSVLPELHATGRVELTFANDANLGGVSVGDVVWKTDDPKLSRELEKTVDDDRVSHPAGLSMTVHAAPGKPLTIDARDNCGNVANAHSDAPLPAADRHPLTKELLAGQLGRLGGTPFALVDLELIGPAGPAEEVNSLAPKSILNALRRAIVEQLTQQRIKQSQHTIAELDALAKLREQLKHDMRQPGTGNRQSADSATGTRRLFVLVRTMEQLQAVAAGAVKPAGIWCDFANASDFGPAIELARSVGLPLGWATPRILTQDTEFVLERIADALATEQSANPQSSLGVLVRNLGAIEFFRQRLPGVQLVGDFSLNAANELTAGLLLSMGLARITPAYDLSPAGLRSMLKRIAPSIVEVIVYQHVPMFHMAHCPTWQAANDSGATIRAASVSASDTSTPNCELVREGRSCRDCTHRCRGHRLAFRDRNGVDHPIVHDIAGRVTVFRGEIESHPRWSQELATLGVRHFRLELLDESAEQTAELVARYADLLAIR